MNGGSAKNEETEMKLLNHEQITSTSQKQKSDK
jgi:hypothetical protein